MKGIILPPRNAFDFVEKPVTRDDLDLRSHHTGLMQTKGHDKIKRVINGIKRLSRSTMANRKVEDSFKSVLWKVNSLYSRVKQKVAILIDD